MGPPGLFAIHILTPPYFYKTATLCAAWDGFLRSKVDRVGGEFLSLRIHLSFSLIKIPHNSAFLLVSVPPLVFPSQKALLKILITQLITL